MLNSRIKLLPVLLGALLVWISSLEAQRELVKVTVQPDETGWNWQAYADSIAGRFASDIEARVNEGLPLREFVPDSLGSTLEYRLRLDTAGHLKSFVHLRPRYRYLDYLIRRTAIQLGAFAPLPEDFPVFYFDATLTFHCRFTPTGRYKRYYFEEPLDTLEKEKFTPTYKSQITTPLFLYEPEKLDKKALLDQFKQRIGLSDEITDTSSFTPLALTARNFAVFLPYDSLTSDSVSLLLLKTRLEAALLAAGATLSGKTYTPPAVQVETAATVSDTSRGLFHSDTTVSRVSGESTAAARDSISAATRDTISAEAGVAEIKAASDSGPNPADTAAAAGVKIEPPKAGEDSAGKTIRDTLKNKPKAEKPYELKRDLASAFASRFEKSYLVFSVCLARVTHADTGLASTLSPVDSGVCHLRLFAPEKPKNLKRRVDFKFHYTRSLPDSLGAFLVQRLTNPPPKPAPPPPPQPKPGPKAPDSSKVVADSSKVAAADTTGAKMAAVVAAAATDSTHPGARADSGSATPGANEKAVPAGSLRSDTSAARPDTLKPAAPATPAAAVDSLLKAPLPGPAPAKSAPVDSASAPPRPAPGSGAAAPAATQPQPSSAPADSTAPADTAAAKSGSKP